MEEGQCDLTNSSERNTGGNEKGEERNEADADVRSTRDTPSTRHPGPVPVGAPYTKVSVHLPFEVYESPISDNDIYKEIGKTKNRKE